MKWRGGGVKMAAAAQVRPGLCFAQYHVQSLNRLLQIHINNGCSGLKQGRTKQNKEKEKMTGTGRKTDRNLS